MRSSEDSQAQAKAGRARPAGGSDAGPRAARKPAAGKKTAASKKAAAKKPAAKKTAKKAPKKAATKSTKKPPAKKAASKSAKKPPAKKAASKSAKKPPAKKAAKKTKDKPASKAAKKSGDPKAKPTVIVSPQTDSDSKRGTPVKTAAAPSRSSRSKGAVRASSKGNLHPVLDEINPVRSSKTSGPLVCVTSPQAASRPTEAAARPQAQGGALITPGAAPSQTSLPPEARPNLESLSLDENRGALSAHGYRLMLMHPESIIEIQTALEEKIGLEAGQILFRGGYVIGLRDARRLKDAEVEEEEIARSVAKRCSAHGWGIFTVESLDLWRHELVFRVEHSPFAYAYGKSSTGVDHLIRGVFSGVCEVIFDKKVVATEAMCRAMGDPYCQFLVG